MRRALCAYYEIVVGSQEIWRTAGMEPTLRYQTK